MIDQNIIDIAVKTATRSAMNGDPVERIIWVPPSTAAEDPNGNFLVIYCSPLSGSETPPWEA